MNLSDLSKKIYVINLVERHDRKQHILKELKKINCENYILFEAINGNVELNNSKLKNGMFGLIKTYLKIYEDWILSDNENIMIIEDDCFFVDDFNQKLKE
jgi:GR25 family glycosyltransferase involved in LPS biosynthesis